MKRRSLEQAQAVLEHLNGLPAVMQQEGTTVQVPDGGGWIKGRDGWEVVKIAVDKGRIFKRVRSDDGGAIQLSGQGFVELFRSELAGYANRDPSAYLDAFDAQIARWLAWMPTPDQLVPEASKGDWIKERVVSRPMSAEHSVLVDARDSLARLRKAVADDNAARAAVAGMDLARSLLHAVEPSIGSAGRPKGASKPHTKFVGSYVETNKMDAKPFPAWKQFLRSQGAMDDGISDDALRQIIVPMDDASGISYRVFCDALRDEKRRRGK